MGSRLVVRFALIYLAILLLSFTVLGVLMEGQVRRGMTEKITQDLLAEGRIIAKLSTEEILKRLTALTRDAGTRMTVVDRNGIVIGDSAGEELTFDNHLNRPEIQESRLKGQGISIRYSATLKSDMLYIALPINGVDREISGYVRLSRPLVEVEKIARHFWRSLLMLVFPVILFTLLLAFTFVTQIILPVRKIALFTEEVADGTHKGVLKVDSRDEIGQLAENVNRMVAVLEEKISVAMEEKGILTAAFESMVEGVIVLDGRNRIERVNRPVAEMTGYTVAELKDKTLLEAFRNADLHDAVEAFSRSREALLVELEMTQRTPRVLMVSISAIHGLSFDEYKTLLVFHDVTRLKQLEKMRVDFVANVSHEIKTPLTNIIGFVETLAEGGGEDPDIRRRFLATIRDNALRLNRLVNDLLTLSSIELGEAIIHLEEVDLNEAIESVLAIVEVNVAEKNLHLVRRIAAALPRIRGDRDRLVQIFINILDNAVKFTSEGGTIAIEATSAEKEIVVRIKDTGIGIPPSEIPKLGQRFFRIDKARSRKLGGTGLGLSIVKHLMGAHGGRIDIESEPGKGTTVSLFFPVVEDV